jgi:hypothetical protein
VTASGKPVLVSVLAKVSTGVCVAGFAGESPEASDSRRVTCTSPPRSTRVKASVLSQAHQIVLR